MSEKYAVYLTGHAETSVEVVADDPDEAVERAFNEVPPFICHQCANNIDLGEEWEPNSVFNEGGDMVWPADD